VSGTDDYAGAITRWLSHAASGPADMEKHVASEVAGYSSDKMATAVQILMHQGRIKWHPRLAKFALVGGVPAPGPQLPHLQVLSKRSSKVKGGGICDRCGLTSGSVWRYAESSVGRPVQVCRKCKAKLVGKPKSAWIPRMRIESSGMESNRRRH
jgi:hypothetical protein